MTRQILTVRVTGLDRFTETRNDNPNRLELPIVLPFELMFFLKTLYLQKVKNKESDDIFVGDILELCFSTADPAKIFTSPPEVRRHFNQKISLN